MKYGLVFANFGDRSDPCTLADLAHHAETAGWDGVFLSDAIQMVGAESLDHSEPWIALAAIAMRTERVTIGPEQDTATLRAVIAAGPPLLD